jgi:hypothetical protein
MQYVVKLGKYRGKRYRNSGDNDGFILSERLLPDGTIVTVKRKINGYNWAIINDDDSYYPLDLLIPVSKTQHILRKL